MLSPDSLDSIFELDRDIFGADRSSSLESLHQEMPDFTFAIRNVNIVEGYGFGRRGCFADHFGPWMATDAQVARRLLEAFLASSGRDTIVVDCLNQTRWRAACCSLLDSPIRARSLACTVARIFIRDVPNDSVPFWVRNSGKPLNQK